MRWGFLLDFLSISKPLIPIDPRVIGGLLSPNNIFVGTAEVISYTNTCKGKEKAMVSGDFFDEETFSHASGDCTFPFQKRVENQGHRIRGSDDAEAAEGPGSTVSGLHLLMLGRLVKKGPLS